MTILGEAFHSNVAGRLADRLQAAGKHALLIFDPANIRYVTGLDVLPTDRPLAAAVWSDGETALFVPQVEADHLAGSGIRDVRWYAEYPADEPPVRWMAREAGTPLLIDRIDAAAWQEIGEEAEDVALSDLVAQLRAVKSPPEIELIEEAAAYADLALERAFARLTTGTSERDALAEVIHTVDTIMRRELGDRYDPAAPSLSGTVQSGTHAAFPNAPAGGRRLARGDSVIVEITANIGGYHAQAGCTFFIGDPLRDVVRWVETAADAQAAARAAMTAGATAESVDLAARKAIDRRGMASGIRHRTGHGTGLERFEAPWLTRSQATPLAVGMVLVNRPGIYVPGRTGARNSETVVIEEDGPRVLNPRIDRWRTMEARLKEF